MARILVSGVAANMPPAQPSIRVATAIGVFILLNLIAPVVESLYVCVPAWPHRLNFLRRDQRGTANAKGNRKCKTRRVKQFRSRNRRLKAGNWPGSVCRGGTNLSALAAGSTLEF